MYTEEFRKVKAKHDQELSELNRTHEHEIFEYKTDKHKLEIRVSYIYWLLQTTIMMCTKFLKNFQTVALDGHIKKLSSQIFTLNENALDLKKDNEFMKNKIFMIENNPHQSRPGRRIAPSSSMSIIDIYLNLKYTIFIKIIYY